jgi:crossover junction endodeoxyribonuclease RusA
MPTLEFILNGPPVSQNAHQRDALHAWREAVRQAAGRAWPPGEPPWNGPLRLTITYFYENTAINTEATLKPIQDALIGLVLCDNSQFSEIRYEKKDLCGNFTVPSLTPVLIEGFSRKGEFLHVQIEASPPAPVDSEDVTAPAEVSPPLEAIEPAPDELVERTAEEIL